jgi:hypothetical protein
MKEIEFRDGHRLVPDHIARALAALETYQLTYEQAMAKINSSFLTDRLRKVQGDLVSEHLARFGTE